MKIPFALFFMLGMNMLLAQNRFTSDATLRQIYGYEYERKIDSLIPYLSSKNNLYRFAAIQSMSSVQDTNAVPFLLQMLALEKVDSCKLALIFSISQHDCDTAFKGLINYYKNCSQAAIKIVCLEAIGKVSKIDVTDLYIQSFALSNLPDETFLHYWLKGLYLAKRRKHIDLNKEKEQLSKCLETILQNNTGATDEINYYYSKIMNQASVAAPEIVKISLKSMLDIDVQLQSLKTPYLQLTLLEKYELSANACREFFTSNYHSLIKYYALDVYLQKHTWNNKVDQVFIESIFDQNDVALISSICEYIIEQNQNNKTVDLRIDILQNTQRQLFLPRDFETWIDLQKAILSFQGKAYQYKSCFETGYQNAIDWNYILKIDAQQKVKITTNKGTMVLLLKVNEAPSSVANFLKLVDEGYYNGKYFHRMVPNFVVQGGCPRGDGWGALEWNQRSELSSNLRYKKGSVGLASVGKDSEGVQFFISHNYAPHLDGRYTIFAEVIKGLDVIGNLVVGDQMLSLERIP